MPQFATLVIQYQSPDEHENIAKAIADLNVIAVTESDEVHRLKLVREAYELVPYYDLPQCIQTILETVDIHLVKSIKDLNVRSRG